MTTKITDINEFEAAIDSFGEIQDTIESLGGEAKIVKQLIETYANDAKLKCHATARYKLRMKCAAPALKRQDGLTEADVAKLMLRGESLRGYVSKTYDAAAIKRDIADPEVLASVGLYLTSPRPHAEVKALRG